MRHQILFLAANPVGLTARKPDEQAREIEHELQLGGERDCFQFVLRPAAQPLDLLRALRKLKPSIVHFVGHTQADGIYLTDNDGRPMQMTRETMRATFGAAGQCVRVVVLDGCATDDLARALCDFVPVCVGTSPPITDAAARAFCLGFYGALADGESTARACSHGRAAMLLQATGDHEPLLRHQDDVDPWSLIFAEGTSRASHAPEAHLSFQEYLVAYYLFVTCSKDEYVDVARSYMGDHSRWEILRLWAALIGDHEPDKLSPVLEALRASMHTYWLAGQMFADGTGQLADFEAWVADLPGHLSNPYSSGEGYAWVRGASKQEVRREKIAAILRSARRDLRWLDGAWHARWCERARLEVNLPPALFALQHPIDSSVAVARSRLLHGAMAGWPDGSELAMLRLWPSTRVAIGVRLQTAITLGAKVRELADMLPQLLAWVEQSQKENPARIKELAREFKYHLSNTQNDNWNSKFNRDSFHSFSRDFACDLARCFIRDLGFRFSRDTGKFLVSEFRRYFGYVFLGLHIGVNYIPNLSRHVLKWHFLRNFSELPKHDLDSLFIKDVSLPGSEPSTHWLSAFLSVETRAVAGRASPRATLAHGRLFGKVPLLILFQAACQASFAPSSMKLRNAVVYACDTFEGDPLWPALARHVTRMSTTMDRALLEDLARHPRKREPPLSWGLQHYVRGDLVLDDDGVITLDELCGQVGLAPLPLLEDVPDELDI